MSRRAAGIINEWIAWELMSGGFRLDPDCPRGPGVSWGLEGFAAGYGVPRHELEAVVGDLDAFVLKLADGMSSRTQFALKITQKPTVTIPTHSASARKSHRRLLGSGPP